MDKVQIKTPADVLPVVKRWMNCRQENFITITLDASHHVIKVHHVSKGLVNRTIVHPRECFYHAIKDNACSILFAHNHPSGYANPSPDDEEVTNRLCMSGQILGFHVLDHIIFTKYSHKWYSFRHHGKINDGDFKQNELDQYVAELLYSPRKEV